jgi:hypothetical protein
MDKIIHNLPGGAGTVLEEALACEKAGGVVSEKCNNTDSHWGIKTMHGTLHFRCCFNSSYNARMELVPPPVQPITAHINRDAVFRIVKDGFASSFNDYSLADQRHLRGPDDEIAFPGFASLLFFPS